MLRHFLGSKRLHRRLHRPRLGLAGALCRRGLSLLGIIAASLAWDESRVICRRLRLLLGMIAASLGAACCWDDEGGVVGIVL
jgi:hypothetical protein